jgi:hypothetical protein
MRVPALPPNILVFKYLPVTKHSSLSLRNINTLKCYMTLVAGLRSTLIEVANYIKFEQEEVNLT